MGFIVSGGSIFIGGMLGSLFGRRISIKNEAVLAISIMLISDRATLMNVLLRTDAYTVGTGIMPSALNEGKIVSVPLESNSIYSVGYITRNDRRPTTVLERFISAVRQFGDSI